MKLKDRYPQHRVIIIMNPNQHLPYANAIHNPKPEYR